MANSTRKAVCAQLLSKLRLRKLSLEESDIEFFLIVYHEILFRDLIQKGQVTLEGFAKIWLAWPSEAAERLIAGDGNGRLTIGKKSWSLARPAPRPKFEMLAAPEEGLKEMMRMGGERELIRLMMKKRKERK